METLVILFIVSIGLMAVLSLTRKSVQFQGVKNNLIIASYLSEEGLELMRNIRDTNIIMGNNYDAWDYLSSPEIGEHYYVVDYNLNAVSVENEVSDPILRLDEHGFYGHDETGDETIFRRLITVRKEGTASSSIESLVSWEDRGQSYNYKLESVLYDVSVY